MILNLSIKIEVTDMTAAVEMLGKIKAAFDGLPVNSFLSSVSSNEELKISDIVSDRSGLSAMIA